MSRMGLAGTASWCCARLSPVSSVEPGDGVAVEAVLAVFSLNGVSCGVAAKVSSVLQSCGFARPGGASHGSQGVVRYCAVR